MREWMNEPGALLLDEGPTLADNKMTERVTIINSKNEAVSILISPDTHLPVSKRFSIRDPKTADKDEEEEIYDNWRMVQGVNTPFSVVVLAQRTNSKAAVFDHSVLQYPPARHLFHP